MKDHSYLGLSDSHVYIRKHGFSGVTEKSELFEYLGKILHLSSHFLHVTVIRPLSPGLNSNASTMCTYVLL